jgi:amino acid adenylation domain-containing protein
MTIALSPAKQALREARMRGLYAATPITRRVGEGHPRQSFAQERLWFVDRLHPGNTAWNLSSRLRLSGETDERALERALGEVVRRHEVLRTVFREVEGVPVQVVLPFTGYHLPVEDLSGLDGAARDARVRRRALEGYTRVYDLAAGPLFVASLLRLGPEERILVVDAHHVIFDKWSHNLLLNELHILYTAYREGRESPLPELSIQYADYSAWERSDGRAAERAAHLAWWKRQLAGAPELLALPTDRPRPPTPSLRGARVPLEVPAEVVERLRALAREEGAPLHTVVLAAWQLLLSKYSGSDDVSVGSPATVRTRPEMEQLIGLIVNAIVMRTDLSGDPTVRELVGRARETSLGAQQHQEVPFEQVVAEVSPERNVSHTLLYQVMLLFDETSRAAAADDDRPWRWMASAEPHPTARFDLTLSLTSTPNGLSGGLLYSTDLFDRATAVRMAEHLVRVLEQFAGDADVRLSRVALMGQAERSQVVEEWNRTGAEYPSGSCIHELFEAQAARTPGAAAVVHDGRALTYAALNARANRLARHLRAIGAGAGTRVALCVERSHEMVVAVLAALKAGAAFIPLDPAYPAERLRFMLDDGAPAALLTRGSLLRLFPGVSVPVVDLDGGAWGELSDANLDRGGVTPESLSFITYTSGSTGRPKGVCHAHHRVLNLVHWYGRELAVTPGDRVLIATSYSFDGTYRNVFAPLFAGAEVHLAAEPFDPGAVVAQIAAGGITMMNLTPTAFGALVDAAKDGELSAMRQVILVGEPVQPRKLLELPEPRPALVNLYGPTECSGIVTFHRLSAGLEPYLDRPVPAGRPIPNARVYILDAHGEPVPVGVVGEIHIGGVPVGPGYHQRPELTAERFVIDPFAAEPGARMYRTGDLGRFLADGTIEVRGRNDAQVKVRGFRVEPGEIEARLAAHPAVREVAVVAREGVPGGTRLVAYYVAADGAVEAEALRAHVAGALPEYMVPAAWVRLDALPVSPNGKLDRRALPEPGREAFARREYEAPQGEVEEALAEIWSEVLGVERVGRWDHFFELGGHSLMAVQVVSHLRQALGVELALGAVFEHPVFATLSDHVLDLQLARFDPHELERLVSSLGEREP